MTWKLGIKKLIKSPNARVAHLWCLLPFISHWHLWLHCVACLFLMYFVAVHVSWDNTRRKDHPSTKLDMFLSLYHATLSLPLYLCIFAFTKKIPYPPDTLLSEWLHKDNPDIESPILSLCSGMCVSGLSLHSGYLDIQIFVFNLI